MRPRTAGILGMVLGLLLSCAAGWMIARPPSSILGALLLVGATVLFAVAATWMARRDWTTQADSPVPNPENPQQVRRWLLLECIASPLFVGVGVWDLVGGEASGWLFVGLGVLGVAQVAGTLHYLSRQSASG